METQFSPSNKKILKQLNFKSSNEIFLYKDIGNCAFINLVIFSFFGSFIFIFVFIKQVELIEELLKKEKF